MTFYPLGPDPDDIVAQAVNEGLGIKVKTADCVNSIMSLQVFQDTNKKDWKRTSKKKNPQGQWVRHFQNKSTAQTCDITEVTGGLNVEPQGLISDVSGGEAGDSDSAMYYNACEITSENLEEYGMGDPYFLGWFSVTVTPKTYWNQHHHIIDHVTPEMQICLDTLNFPAEDCDSVYTLTPQQMAAVQTSPWFYNLPEMEQFLDSLGA